MLTVKSDDVIGRNKLYESIIKGQKPKIWGLPESFNFVTYLFKGLGQNVQPLTAEELEQIHQERTKKIVDLWLSGLMDTTILNLQWWIDEDIQEKEEIIDNVIQEMEDFGDLE
jgi:hypothetical protein